MAHITSGFSFAFLQECFVATLLILARGETGLFEESDDDDLEEYELWRAFKEQANILRKEVEGQSITASDHSDRDDGSAQLFDLDMVQVGEAYSGSADGLATSQLALPNLEQLHVKEQMLPTFPYAFQKKRWINDAAWNVR